MDFSVFLNPVVLAVVVLLALSAMRFNVVFALIIAAAVGGMLGAIYQIGGENTINGFAELGRMSFGDQLSFFNSAFQGVLGTSGSFMSSLDYGAGLAMQYVMLGTFAIALNRSGLTSLIAKLLFAWVEDSVANGRMFVVKYGLLLVLTFIAISSQNLIPMHIAFIPVLIPPLLVVFEKLKLDRRMIACVLTFGLITPYMVFPVGFGKIYMHKILLGTINSCGVIHVTPDQIQPAMLLPALGMLTGLLIAVFVSYRKPREYDVAVTKSAVSAGLEESSKINWRNIIAGLIAILVALVMQIFLDSLIFGALLAVMVFVIARMIAVRDTQDLFVHGVSLMGGIGIIMICAAGFASVMKATGGVQQLVSMISNVVANSGGDGSAMLIRAIAVFCMLLIGLVVTMGIGSSFSTVPLIATIYVPICVALGMSPLAIIAVIGAAGALGDAGSPVSESVLGPTAGLNADGQHDHIYDSTIPTFLHYNIPMLVAGWIAGVFL